jgi:hypothetical protein
MLAINKEELLRAIDLDDLKQYMLYTLIYGEKGDKGEKGQKEGDKGEKEGDKEEKEVKVEKGELPILNVPKNQIQIKYTKKYSKYNEPAKINNSKHYADKLFWIFYKLVHNFNDIDLENINAFKVMKDFKIECVEKVRLQKNILKEFKIQRMVVEDDLTNNDKICFKTFHALCVLYLINVIVIRDNNTYCILCTNDDEKVINLTNYKLLQISNVKMSASFNDFDVQLINNYSETQLQAILKNYYNIENIEKPIRAFSSYNLDDLTTIASKLNITIYDEHGKKKKKQDIYETLLKKLT